MPKICKRATSTSVQAETPEFPLAIHSVEARHPLAILTILGIKEILGSWHRLVYKVGKSQTPSNNLQAESQQLFVEEHYMLIRVA